MNAEFRAYFSELYDGKQPFPWQERLLRQVIEEGWPGSIDLPTASGKTSCIDVAIFALAAGIKTPRRIFFVVDRRIIVNDTYRRYQLCADKLANATSGALAEVASSLRELAGLGPEEKPLDVYQLRGGIYRDQSWVRSVLQPTVITSTVDQVGSRLLFRGYGVSPNTWPVHAGLVANDALIFLDEAHCSRAFAQTLQTIRKYRSAAWTAESLDLPFEVIEMTATPIDENSRSVFRLEAEDRTNEVLYRRLTTSKPASLHTVSAKPDDTEAMAKALVAQTLSQVKAGIGGRYAVIANRIATARRVAGMLREHFAKNAAASDATVSLVIGRMRAVDRDDQLEELDHFRAGTRKEAETSNHILVSTQCIEVGADFDFDSIITESASIDALLQRFGRLDRLGERDGAARAVIVMPAKAIGAKTADVIYGRALEATWEWLTSLAEDGTVDFAIESRSAAIETIPQQLKALPREQSQSLKRIGKSAPALLPAHIDALCQTSPPPHVEPAVSLFLHGAESAIPDVRIVWRADLEVAASKTSNESCEEEWLSTILLCPPASTEAMPVRFTTFRRWARNLSRLLQAKSKGTNESKDAVSDRTETALLDVLDTDLEGISDSDDGAFRDSAGPVRCPVLRWRGKESEILNLNAPADLDKVRPGDTLVVPSSYPGWGVLGHIPDSGLAASSQPLDFGDRTALLVRGHPILRLHPAVLSQWPENSESKRREVLEKCVNNPETADVDEITSAIDAYVQDVELPDWLKSLLISVRNASTPRLLPHPSGRGTILIGRKDNTTIAEDEGNDETSFQRLVTLEDHLTAVREKVASVARRLLPSYQDVMSEAGDLHDLGKTDPRFQTLLRGGDLLAAMLAPKPLAKGDRLVGWAFTRAWKNSNLPDDFRHELASLHFAEASLSKLRPEHRDLLLHLIASHHGRCRPFAPAVLDAEPPPLMWQSQKVTSSQRLTSCAHRLDSGVARRFWALNRRYGWWGIAFLEAAFRISDWAASATNPDKVGQQKEELRCQPH